MLCLHLTSHVCLLLVKPQENNATVKNRGTISLRLKALVLLHRLDGKFQPYPAARAIATASAACFWLKALVILSTFMRSMRVPTPQRPPVSR